MRTMDSNPSNSERPKSVYRWILHELISIKSSGSTFCDVGDVIIVEAQDV